MKKFQWHLGNLIHSSEVKCLCVLGCEDFVYEKKNSVLLSQQEKASRWWWDIVKGGVRCFSYEMCQLEVKLTFYYHLGLLNSLKKEYIIEVTYAGLIVHTYEIELTNFTDNHSKETEQITAKVLHTF